jgi:aspartate racemase
VDGSITLGVAERRGGALRVPPENPRVLGIVGGTGPESTIGYYRSLVATWRRRRPDGSFPRVIIDSVEGGGVIRMLGQGDLEGVGREVGAALGALARAGCSRALLASNAVHLALDRIDPAPPMPLIHIVDVTRDTAIGGGHRRLGILGTRFVMQSRLYADRFEPAGLTIVIPRLEEQDAVHEIYLGELVEGVFRDDSREHLVELIAAMRDRDGIDGLILGGTELALTLTEPTYAGVPILNTAQIHVDAAVDWLLGGVRESQGRRPPLEDPRVDKKAKTPKKPKQTKTKDSAKSK